MLPHGNSVLDHIEDVGNGIPHDGKKLPFIAVPTTSGTGSEATQNAVVTEIGPRGFKKSIRHENFISDAVIIDGSLLTSIPKITASCGFDALTQLIESFISCKSTSFSDAIALSGLEQFLPNFINACFDGANDIRIRQALGYAAFCSGIALTNADLGIVHGTAVPLGGIFQFLMVQLAGHYYSSLKVNIKTIMHRIPLMMQ